MRLQAICEKEIKRGKAPKYVEKSGTLVFAQKCNTKKGHINLSLAQYLDESTLHKYPVDLYTRYNDIIINSTGTGTLGRIGIFQESDDTMQLPIVPDSHITTVRAFSDNVAKYVYLFLKAYQCYFENAGEGSTNQKELRPEVIKAFLIAIPPYFEQKRIVEKFEKTCNFIDLLDTHTDDFSNTIKSIKLKILDLAVRGKLVPQDPSDEPASALLERIRAEKEELIKQGKIKRDKKESIIFKGEDNSYYENLPSSWTISCLGEITNNTLLNDGDWIVSENMDVNGSVKLIQLGSIGYMHYINKGFKYISESTFVELSCTQIHPSYLLINRIINERMCACILPNVDGKLITTVDTCWIAPNDCNYNLKYLLYAISSPMFQTLVLKSATGVTRKRISKNNLICLPLPIPPLEEQKRIASVVESYLKILDILINNI